MARTARASPGRPAGRGVRAGRGRRRQALAGRRTTPSWRRGWSSEAPAVWVLGGPDETPLAAEIAAAAAASVRDLTGTDLRNAILALAAADAAVPNDSGLMHVAAAIGTPTIGIFGPTSPWHWAPLNPLAAILEPPGDQAMRTACPAAGQSRRGASPHADMPVEHGAGARVRRRAGARHNA